MVAVSPPLPMLATGCAEMNQTQSIIVYRNPMEQAMWEGLMSSSSLIPIMLGLVAFMVAMLVIARVSERIYNYRQPNWMTPTMFVVSGAIGIIVANFFWI